MNQLSKEHQRIQASSVPIFAPVTQLASTAISIFFVRNVTIFGFTDDFGGSLFCAGVVIGVRILLMCKKGLASDDNT